MVLAAVVLTPFALRGPYGAIDVLTASLVYGGLLGLAAGFVYVDRLHARGCPRCGVAQASAATACSRCAYDLAARPRYACGDGHATYLDAGNCSCGRRLELLPAARGVGREVVLSLKFGGGLLVILLGVGLLLHSLGA